MKTRTASIGIAVLIALMIGLGPNTGWCAETARQPRGIILLIGDGMGINQIRSAAVYAKEVLGKTLIVDSIVTRGITTTHSANSEVTDSAAAATAMYSGHKVVSEVINVLPDGRKVFGIGHAAKNAGLSVGVVSTTRLTHATPAALYGHASNRDQENLIADQLPAFSPEVAMGGGLRHFLPRDRQGSTRSDGRNLVDDMIAKGYRYVTNGAELASVDPAGTDKLLGLFADSHMAYELDRGNVPELGNQPSLADMTRFALATLGRNPNGFFVMIEGGRIDHACHSHDIKASIHDTIAFDDAVRVALEYQKAHSDVLVVVTADHETGGLGLGRGTEYALDMKALGPITNSTEYLSRRAKREPDKLDRIVQAGGFDLTDRERAFLSKHPAGTKASSVQELRGYGKRIDKYLFSWMHYALGAIASERAKVGWTAFVHTAQPVITFAAGPGEEEFAGSYDNTDMALRMAKLLRLALDPPAAESSRKSNVRSSMGICGTPTEGASHVRKKGSRGVNHFTAR
ncbi:MAG: alkaline phosphatase [Thermodesulfobacteriota bacterium]